MRTYVKILTYPLLAAAALACVVLTIWNLEAFFETIEFVTLAYAYRAYEY